MTDATPWIDAPTLASRVAALADAVRTHHLLHAPHEPLVVLGVLKGAFVFASDLVRALHPLDVRVDFVGIRSYAGTERTDALTFTLAPSLDLRGARVVVAEDIVDTGHTLEALRAALERLGAADVRVCALLDKPSRREVPVAVDWVGFQIPDRFVVGYGLDVDQQLRQLPFVGLMDGDVPDEPVVSPPLTGPRDRA